MSPIYLDYNATTPMRPEAMAAFQGAATVAFANASSIHGPGLRAGALLDQARESLASMIGVRAKEIVFTSGGTESDNLAIRGVVAGCPQGHIVTSCIEHPAVLETCRALEREGHRVTCVGVDRNGTVDADAVAAAVSSDTALITIMWVNNETGVIQPMEAIAAIARERKIPLHTDAVQAFPRIAVDAGTSGVSLVSISGHKFGAPKGIGALVVRSSTHLSPFIFGGGQEWNLRSGTHNVAGAVAMEAAAAAAMAKRETESQRLASLRDRLETGILDSVPRCAVNGGGAARVSNTSNIRFDGADGEALLLALDALGIAASSASACAASHTEPSHVLMAMGLTRRQAEDSMRFSLGHDTTEDDIDRVVAVMPGLVAGIRALN